jgi:hypothetical protein
MNYYLKILFKKIRLPIFLENKILKINVPLIKKDDIKLEKQSFSDETLKNNYEEDDIFGPND